MFKHWKHNSLMKFYDWAIKRGSSRNIDKITYTNVLNLDGTVEHVKNVDIMMTKIFLFRTSLLGITLHRWFRGDNDDVHDHPWNTISICINGIMVEEFADGTSRKLRKFIPYYRQAEVFHKVYIPKMNEGYTWSIFIRFRRRRKWGFLDRSNRGMWVNHEKYAADRDMNIISSTKSETKSDYKLVGIFMPKVIPN